MPYIIDENNNHILDEYNNKIEFNVSHSNTTELLKHKEPLHIDENGFINTEDRYISIKEGIKPDHAVNKKQLDQLDINIREHIDKKYNDLYNLIDSSISILFKNHEAKIIKQMLKFRNDQIKNRIQRKYMKIPKNTHQWIKLLDYKDLNDASSDLKNTIILNVFIRRWDRYHNSKSALLEKDFNNSIEFFYNADMTAYFTYFTSVPNGCSMEAIVEWLRIPKNIQIDNENIPVNPEIKIMSIDNEANKNISNE